MHSLVANSEGYGLMKLKVKLPTCYDDAEFISISLADYSTPVSLVISKAARVKLPKRCEVFLEFHIENFNVDNNQ